MPSSPSIAPPRTPVTNRTEQSSDGRTIDLTRRLPSGRAVLGGALIVLAALGLFIAADPGTGAPTTHYLVARRSIVTGHVLTSSDVVLVAMTLPDRVAAESVPSLTTAVGAITLAPVAAGQLIVKSQIATGARATRRPLLSFSIDADRAAGGDLRPGDRIDVLVTWDHTTDGDTELVGHDLHVIAIARPDGDALGQVRKLTISVNVTGGPSLIKLTRAIRSGQLTIVRTTGSTTPQ